MKLWERYHTPNTVDEAASLLAHYAGQARVIAGGTDLLIDLRSQPDHTPQHALIDITRIPELCDIYQDGDTVLIGAGVTHTQIVQAPTLAQRATCLVESCGVIGGPQVRNVATLGGNVAHALPAGDGTTSLIALAAEVEVLHAGQRRWVTMHEMFLGPGQSLLDSTRDLLLRFRFRLAGTNQATAFDRIMRPQGVALPVLGCAVWVELSTDHARYETVRVCLAPVGPKPMRATAVEQALAGQPISDTTLESALQAAHQDLKPRTSKYRATAAYRHAMIDVLLRRTLQRAAERVRTGEVIPQGVGQ